MKTVAYRNSGGCIMHKSCRQKCTSNNGGADEKRTRESFCPERIFSLIERFRFFSLFISMRGFGWLGKVEAFRLLLIES